MTNAIDKSDYPTTYKNLDELMAKATELFGDNKREWAFVCPSCNSRMTVQQWVDYAGSPEEASHYIGFTCIGRLIKRKQGLTEDKNDPIHQIKVGAIGDKNIDYCNYTAGGLFNLNPVTFTENKGTFFQFAQAERSKA